MKTNLRSKHVDPNVPAGDGSFNIASTHGEGEGFGHFGPAVQTDAKEAAPIKSILQILHRLYQLVMPLCISRFEWEFMELNRCKNNVLAFGGLEPGPPSCQVNSSSAANVIDLDVQSVGENTGPVLTNTSRRAHVEEVDNEDDHPASHLHPTSPFVILEPIEPEMPATQDSFMLVDLTDLIYAELKKAGALDASIGANHMETSKMTPGGSHYSCCSSDFPLVVTWVHFCGCDWQFMCEKPTSISFSWHSKARISILARCSRISRRSWTSFRQANWLRNSSNGLGLRCAWAM
ncbi:hypothetical protein K438DRAFT_694634 [Mycena galopus ATCC 62051]|nr:hypothetical protein K438DRAFT_694634 [Mycena galopus ATCC 62051]